MLIVCVLFFFFSKEKFIGALCWSIRNKLVVPATSLRIYVKVSNGVAGSEKCLQ